MKHDTDNVESEYTYTARRRGRIPQDRFEIRDGAHDVVATFSSQALAIQRRDELEAQESHFRGRLTIVDTWSAK